MTATVEIEIARSDNVLRIPTSALRFTPTAEMFTALNQPVPQDLAEANRPRQQGSGLGRTTQNLRTSEGSSSHHNPEALESNPTFSSFGPNGIDPHLQCTATATGIDVSSERFHTLRRAAAQQRSAPGAAQWQNQQLHDALESALRCRLPDPNMPALDD